MLKSVRLPERDWTKPAPTNKDWQGGRLVCADWPNADWPKTPLASGLAAKRAAFLTAVRNDPWRIGAMAAIVALTVWRLAWLRAAQAELSVDEAQYWFWGQHPAFGYYSKPPLIGWIIGATTGLLHSDSPFVIRLAAPLLHAGTAALVLALTARLAGPKPGAVAALMYLTMPAVVVGSLTISTDTPMMFCLALAMLLLRQLAERASPWRAMALGAAIGFGMLAKYAMLFAVPGLVLTVLLVPGWRIRPRDALLAAAVAGAIMVPNLIWNLENGFATLRHTAEISRWQGLVLHPDKAAEFIASQFAVFGPVLFAAMLWMTGRAMATRVGRDDRAMLLMAMPVLLIVAIQALLSHALANWAVGAGVAGSILATTALLRRLPRLLLAGLVLNGAIALVLPVLPALAINMPLPGGNLLFKRYMGHEEISLFALDHAREAGLPVIVAGTRPLLADLFYQVRDGGPAIFAAPPKGLPGNHYEQLLAFPPNRLEDVLYLAEAGPPPRCAPSVRKPVELGRITAGPGWAAGTVFVAFRVPARCIRQPLPRTAPTQR